MAVIEDQAKNVYVRLSQVLADTFVLYLKTHNFHWNVVGSDFPQLHSMFGDQYKNMWEAVDVIAEKIRILGFYAPGTLDYYKQLSTIQEERSIPSSDMMVEQLCGDHRMLVDSVLYPAFYSAQEAGLEDLANFLAERIDFHNKTCWMLKSTSFKK